jgi:hypothetical protein
MITLITANAVTAAITRRRIRAPPAVDPTVAVRPRTAGGSRLQRAER